MDKPELNFQVGLIWSRDHLFGFQSLLMPFLLSDLYVLKKTSVASS